MKFMAKFQKGLYRIITNPGILITDYMVVGGMAIESLNSPMGKIWRIMPKWKTQKKD